MNAWKSPVGEVQLAAIGVPRIQLIDFDTVDHTNVTN
jgi:tRNA A37 threonylcarbamoyladenosine dehydratase